MDNFLSAILRRVAHSIGVVEAEEYIFKALMGTPHDVHAVEVATLRKFFEYSATTPWFSLEIINPSIEINGQVTLRAGSITLLMRQEEGKWSRELIISDYETAEPDVDYKIRWGFVATAFLRLLELIHLIHWISEILLGSH